MKTKIGYVLNEQLQKDEVDELEVDRARDELIRIKQLYNLLNNQPLINVTNEENDQIDLKTPRENIALNQNSSMLAKNFQIVPNMVNPLMINDFLQNNLPSLQSPMENIEK
ncbi:unnamed protein product [Rotaria sordida]|uniref:Uncharacterized protein n=1 Tax=Rotaria sordida TaxID=392033 RepID=A0A815ESA0_9BILA|nr:unnamed protein product [Rotaria sordida]